MTFQHRTHSATAIGGFSLLEVLVTIVVVSIGLLGILGMQTASLVNTQLSASRSTATILADNFAARMVTNPRVDYDVTSDSEGQIDRPDVRASCTQTSNSITCTDAKDIRKLAVWQWSKALQNQLPSGRGSVTCQSDCNTDHSVYRIKVTWHALQPNKASNGSKTSSGRKNKQKNAKKCNTELNDGSILRCYVTKVRL